MCRKYHNTQMLKIKPQKRKCVLSWELQPQLPSQLPSPSFDLPRAPNIPPLNSPSRTNANASPLDVSVHASLLISRISTSPIDIASNTSSSGTIQVRRNMVTNVTDRVDVWSERHNAFLDRNLEALVVRLNMFDQRDGDGPYPVYVHDAGRILETKTKDESSTDARSY